MHIAATPDQVFAFVDSLMSDSWPVLEADALAFLYRHGCEVLNAHRGTERTTRVARWRHPGLDVWGTWTSSPASGTRVNFFLKMNDEALLVEELSARYGAPCIVGRNPLSPHALWQRDELAITIDTYAREPGPSLIELAIGPARIVRQLHTAQI